MFWKIVTIIFLCFESSQCSRSLGDFDCKSKFTMTEYPFESMRCECKFHFSCDITDFCEFGSKSCCRPDDDDEGPKGPGNYEMCIEKPKGSKGL